MKFYERVEEHWPGKSEEIKALIEGDKDPEDYEAVAQWVRECYHRPKVNELIMAAIDVVIEGHGVEAIFAECAKWPDMEYVNQGDTYNPTIIHDRLRGTYRCMSWGDWIEEAERQGRHYP